MGQWDLLIWLYGPMGAPHLVKTKRTLTDELPTVKIWKHYHLSQDVGLPSKSQSSPSKPKVQSGRLGQCWNVNWQGLAGSFLPGWLVLRCSLPTYTHSLLFMGRRKGIYSVCRIFRPLLAVPKASFNFTSVAYLLLCRYPPQKCKT